MSRTALSPDNCEHIAVQLADSPYTGDELRNILLDGVLAICVINLRQVTGNRSGFDPA